jgi:hypothetical protein
MRNFLLLLSILICICTSGYNQVIKGTVLDQRTKNPIGYALVYFNGTSVGTYADKNGYFELDNSKNISLPLTISALGYNSETITDFLKIRPLLIQLTPQVFELKEVFITGKGNPQARQTNLALFKREFLGATQNANRCVITNESDISLLFNSKDETLRAFSSKPIIIDNKALGYKIFYYMNKFEFCKTNNKLSLLGNYIFKEDSTSNKIQQQRFEKRRETTYLGSRMHFFRTLWENNLDSGGFTVKDSANVRLSYDKLVVQTDSLNISVSGKYLKYRGKLYVTYGKKQIGSNILITKEYVYFDKIGFFDPTGITWEGEMATQLIADLLPFEYSLSGQGSTQLIQPSKQDTVKHALLVSELTSGQNQIIESLEEYVQLSQTLPSEKIYLHIDRPNYMQGDTIWFKAYSWYGYEQIPDTISGILYVDLINPLSRVILKRKLLIQNGTSQGDLCLDTTISPGRYILRAYTKWMQNQNTGEPFYQSIIINPANQNFQVECAPVIIKQPGNDSLKIGFRFFEISRSGDLSSTYKHDVNYSLKIGDQLLQKGNVFATNTKEQVFKCNLAGISQNDSAAVFGISIHDNSLTFEKQFRIPLQEGIDLQFFPEGGTLVNGLESRLAFKAIGTDGLCRQVAGEIKDVDENTILSFESTHKGMGTFLLRPEVRKEYFAHLWYNNRKYIIPLPHALEKGCVMSVNFTGIGGNDPFLTIKKSNTEENTLRYVIGSVYGKIWFSALVKFVKDSIRFRIPLELLPEGVCRLTVLNEDFKPECERLFFVDKNQLFKIEISPDSSSYGGRSKVTLLIKTTGNGGEPVQTDMSLAVIDKDQITKDIEINGICDYKLLQSEIQGHIEDIGYYFKDGRCTNYDTLDLLLLTQGYRKFIPDNTNPDKLKFQPERNFDISGMIKFSGSKSREKKYNYKNIGLTLMCKSERFYLDQSKSDSLGRFKFQIPLLNGKSPSLIQATTSRRKQFYGEIVLDETIFSPRFKSQPISPDKVALPVVEYINQLQAAKKTEISKNPAYGIKTINLPEVTVKARAKNWYQDYKKEAIKIANLDSLDPDGKRYETLYDLLIREFGAKERIILHGQKTILLPSEGWGPSYWFPIYLINGKAYFNGAEKGEMFLGWLNYISSIHVNEIKTLMVLPPGEIPAYYADPILRMEIRQSLVVIETYSNEWYRGNPQGIKTFILDGLDVPRVFYSPRYDYPKKDNQIYDGRVTLYWKPSIRTDSNGNAKVEFFASDRQTRLDIIVNGIEVATGAPGQGKATISSILSK